MRLTQDVEQDGVGGGVSLGVARLTRVVPGLFPLNPLQHQTFPADYQTRNSGCRLLLDMSSLQSKLPHNPTTRSEREGLFLDNKQSDQITESKTETETNNQVLISLGET